MLVWTERLIGASAAARIAKLARIAAALTAGVALGAGTAFANPLNGQVVSGNITMAVPDPSTLTVQQTTNKGIIDWQSFNIATGEKTVFQQPSSAATTLNRVSAGNPSTIAGQLSANGNLILVNPSGVVFSKGSQVNANSLLVTPTNISNQNFLAGKMIFDQPGDPNATVTNAGRITVADKGLAALVAPGVANSGVIRAKLGKVVLGGASTYAIDFYGDGLLSFDVGPNVAAVPLGPDGKPVGSLVSNTGRISAPGGTVLLTADAVAGLLANVVDAGGSISARTATTPAGTVSIGNINIDAGPANGALVDGKLNVSGLRPGQTGGNVSVTGNSVALAPTARIDARGHSGGGTVKIGGGPHGTDPTIRNAQTTLVATGATIDASATTSGNGGNVTVWSDVATSFDGRVLARGGALGGDGGWVETSGHKLYVGNNALVDASALAPGGKPGTWLLDPADLTVTTADNNLTTNDNGTTTTYSPDGTGGSTVADATINGALTLPENVILTTVGSAPVSGETGKITIDVSAAISWSTAKSLTINAAGDIVINGTIAGSNAGSSLVLDASAGTGSITISNAVSAGSFSATAGTGGIISLNNATPVTTKGASGQTFNSPVTLLASATLDSSAGPGPIALNGQVTGGTFDLTLTSGTGNQTLSGVTTSGNLTQNFSGAATDTLKTGTYTITGTNPYVFPAVTTNGTLTIGAPTNLGAVTLATDTTFNSSAASAALTFSTIDSNAATAQALTVNTGTGTVSLGGAIGSSHPLSGLSVTAAAIAFPATTVNGNLTAEATTGAITQTAAATVTGTSSFTTDAAADITLDQSNALTGEVTLASGGAATVTNTLALEVKGTVTGLATLTAPSVQFDGLSAGSLIALANATDITETPNGLTVTGTSSLTAKVGAAAAITLNTATNTLGDTITLDNTGATGGIALKNSGGTKLGATNTGGNLLVDDTTGSITQNEVATITGISSFKTDGTGSTITLTQANALTGNVTLATHADTAATASLTNTVATNLAGPANIGGDLTITDSNDLGITLHGVNLGGNLILTSSVPVTLDAGTYTIVPVASPYVFNAVTTNGNLVFSQATNFGAVTLGTSTTFDSSAAAAPLIFTGAINGSGTQGLTVTAGTSTVTFNAAAAVGPNVTTLGVTGSTITLGSTVTTTGSQSYTGALTLNGTTYTTTTSGTFTETGATTLGADVTIDTSAGGQNITFQTAGTINGAHALTLNAGAGAVTLGQVGGTTPLIGTGLTITGAAVSLAGVGASALAITNSGVLTLNTGTYTITTPVPYTFNAITTNGTLTLGQVTDFLGTVTLGGDTTINETSGLNANINFNGASITGAHAFEADAGTGTVTFGAAIGATALTTFTVDSAAVLGANVTTSGAQDYKKALSLNGDILLVSNSGGGTGTITFEGTLDSFDATPRSLGITAGGLVTFKKAVGSTNPLSTLTVTDPEIDANITTAGTQTYNNPVTIGAAVILNSDSGSAGGNIVFGDTVNSTAGNTFGLTLTAGAGAISFAKTVGATDKLASLTVTTGATTLLSDSVTTTGVQSYGTVSATALTLTGGKTYSTNGAAFTETGATTIAGAGTATVDTTGGGTTTTGAAITFQTAGTIDGAAADTQSLTLNAGTGGTVTLGGAVGTTELQNFVATGGSFVLTNTGSILTNPASGGLGMLALTSAGTSSLLDLTTVKLVGETVELKSADGISQTAGSATNFINATGTTANTGLSVISSGATGSVSLTANNAVPRLAFQVAGAGNSFAFTDAATALTITTVGSKANGTIVGGTTGFGGGIGGKIQLATTTSGNITIGTGVATTEGLSSNGGDIDIAAAQSAIVNQIATIASANGNIVLLGDALTLSGGAGTGAITGGTGTVVLGPSTVGNAIQLGTASAAGILGLQTADFATITAGAVQVGYRSATGTTSFSGNITIAGATSVNSANIPSLILVTGSGQVTQTAALTFTGGTLGILSGGKVDLSTSPNAVGTLAGSVDGATSTFAFVNNTALSVGALTSSERGVTVAATGLASSAAMTGVTNPLSGVQTASGDIRVDAGGTLTLAKNICSGALACGGGATNNTALTATAGNVTETAGLVQANGLSVVASGSVQMNQANGVGTLAGSAGSSFTFTNAGALTVGSVAAVLGAPSQTNVATTTSNIGIVASAGDLTLESNVCAGSAACATAGTTIAGLAASAGSVSETTGFVKALDLAVVAGQSATLNNANNQVGILAGQSGADFAFQDAQALTIGTVSVAGIGSLSGVTSTAGNVTATTTVGDLTLANNVTAANASLTAAGNLTGGSVNAGGLSAIAGSAVALAGSVGSVSGSAGTSFAYNNTGALTETGITASSGALSLTTTGGGLTLTGNLSDANNTTTLTAGGAINQNGGVITAATLTGSATGATSLNGGNVIGTLAAFNAGGAFNLNDTIALSIAGNLNAAGQTVSLTDASSIAETGGATISAATLTGSSGTTTTLNSAGNAIATLANYTSGDNFSLTDGVALSLNGNQTVSNGKMLALAVAGRINQVAGTVTAGTLTMSGSGGIVFNDPNQVTTLGTTTNSGAGGVLFTDAPSLTVAGAVNGGSGIVDLISRAGSLTTNAGATITAGTNALLTAAQSITLGANLSAGGTTTLAAGGGNLSETGTATVSAPSLIITAGGSVALNNVNSVANLAAVSGQPFGFVNGGGLTIGTISGGSASFPSGASINFTGQSGLQTGGATRVRANSGDIVVAANVSAGNMALVASAGSIAETNGAAVSATGLILDASGNATFGSSNSVGTLAGNLGAGGSLSFVNGPGLTIGTVTGPLDVATQSGFFAGLNVTLQSFGGVTITGNITADPGGDMLITAGGAMTVNGNVTLTATNNIILASGGAFNQVGTLTVKGPDLVVDTTGQSLAAKDALANGAVYTQGKQILTLGTGQANKSNAINFNGTLAANGSVVLLLANSGVISGGNVNVGQLGVAGTGGSASLFGCLGSNCSTAAAEQGFAFPTSTNDYRFNTCAIGSVSCVVLPALTPIQPEQVSNFAVLVAQPAQDDVDAPLTNIFDENRLCDQLYRTSPEVARMVCQ